MLKRVIRFPRSSLFRGENNVIFSTFPPLSSPFSSSTSNNKIEFDKEITDLYSKIAECHRHEKGPWNLITKQVLKYLQSTPSSSSSSSSPRMIVDLASGPGEPASSIAKAIAIANNNPNNKNSNINNAPTIVVATDISPEMVQKAATSTLQIPNIKTLLCDVQDLSVFPANSVDVVTCCYGLMFPQDKLKALQEIHRVVKEEGIVVVTYWQTLDLININADIMQELSKTAPTSSSSSPSSSLPVPPTMNPLSLLEPGLFESLSDAAGFSIVSKESSEYPFNLGSNMGLSYKLSTMVNKTRIDEMGGEAAHAQAEKIFRRDIFKYAVKEDVTGNLIVKKNVFAMVALTKNKTKK